MTYKQRSDKDSKNRLVRRTIDNYSKTCKAIVMIVLNSFYLNLILIVVTNLLRHGIVSMFNFFFFN